MADDKPNATIIVTQSLLFDYLLPERVELQLLVILCHSMVVLPEAVAATWHHDVGGEISENAKAIVCKSRGKTLGNDVQYSFSGRGGPVIRSNLARVPEQWMQFGAI